MNNKLKVRCVVLYKKDQKEGWNPYPYIDQHALLQFYRESDSIWLTENTFTIEDNKISSSVLTDINKYITNFDDFYIKQINIDDAGEMEKLQNEIDINLGYLLNGQ